MNSQVKKERVAIGTIRQLEEKGKLIARLEDGLEVAVFKKSDHSLAAVENYCPHKGGPLALGKLRGETVVCPWHGFRFDISSGTCADTQSILKARTFSVLVSEETVYIER